MEWKPVWHIAKMIFHKLTAISGIRNKHKKRRKDGNLMKKTDQDNRDKNQAERLRKTLKSFGINTSEELDQALAASLDAMTIGIMTDVITAPAHSA